MEVKLIISAYNRSRAAGDICPNFWLLPNKDSDPAKSVDTPRRALGKCLRLFASPAMLLLCVYIYHSGMCSSFRSVYGTALARTRRFADPKALPGLTGIADKVGTILGGVAVVIFGSWINKVGRWKVVVLSMACDIVAGVYNYLYLLTSV